MILAALLVCWTASAEMSTNLRIETTLEVNKKPKIASLRGNVLDVDPNSDAGQKQQIFDALSAVYTLELEDLLEV